MGIRDRYLRVPETAWRQRLTLELKDTQAGAGALFVIRRVEVRCCIKPWAKRMAENTRLAGVCVGAGAVRRDSVWVVSYWYVRTSRATGLSSSSAEPLGSRLSAVI